MAGNDITSSLILNARGDITNEQNIATLTTVMGVDPKSASTIDEYVLTYDGRPSYTVSIMEFVGGKVARETQYFGDPFEPGSSRAQWVEMD